MNWDQRSMSPPESAYLLLYCTSINRFIDEDGNILHDLSDLFDVWQLDEWKRHQDYDILLDRKGDWCELYYPSNFEERDFLESIQIKLESRNMDELYLKRRLKLCVNLYQFYWFWSYRP